MKWTTNIRDRLGRWPRLFYWFPAFFIGLLPVLCIPVIGYRVPTAAQPDFNAPAPEMTPHSEWLQTFLFPGRPVSAVELRPGTYGRELRGQVTGTVGAIIDIHSTEKPSSVRQFKIALDSIRNNHWHVFRFSPLDLPAGTPSGIRLDGKSLHENMPVTFWRHTQNLFPDGEFIVSDRIQKGDLAFKVLCKVRGLDILRMIKSRWSHNRPLLWKNPLWLIVLIPCWGIGFAAVIQSLRREWPR